MKIFYYNFLCALFFFSVTYVQCNSINVRVLLSKSHFTERTTWTFVSKKGFFIHIVSNKVKKKPVFQKKIKITVQKGILFCNDKKINGDITIKPVSGYAECNGVEYDGSFYLVKSEKSFLCINEVDLEDYIVAVLRTESWPGWPLEVNKAFAITCRSYVVSKIYEAQKLRSPFHVKNSNVHQTYKGRHDVKVLKQAVAQTKGTVLGFNGEPILAMFDSCCGSVIPAHIADFDFKKAPYLARTYPCLFCKQCSLYSWQVSYELHVFEELMKQHDKEIQKLYGVCITKKDEAGLVEELLLKLQKGKIVTLSGKQMYSLLKEVKSFHFDVRKHAGKITLSGRGFGHHIGLCQWGARQMVREGHSYKSILRFYYPGTYLMKVA